MVERYVSRGTWGLKTVGDVLRVAARRAPDRIALVEGSRSVNYREYNEATERLGAALLQVGLCPGDRVLFQMGNSIETAFALLACFKVGLIPVCTLPQHREVEITLIAAITGAAGYIVQGDASKNFDLVGFAKEKLRGHATLRHLIVARGTVPLGAHALEDLIGDSP